MNCHAVPRHAAFTSPDGGAAAAAGADAERDAIGAVGRLGAPDHRDGARAHHLDDAERAQDVDQAVDLVAGAGDLGDERLGPDVDHAGAEDLAEAHHLAARRRVGAHLDERELAHHRRRVARVLDEEHVDQLVEVGLDAPRRVLVGLEDDGHARTPGRSVRPTVSDTML